MPSATLHDRIRAKVAEVRAATPPFADDFLRFCDHADRILDRHQPARGGHDCACGHGGTDERYDPQCPEIRDLAVAWGVEP